MLFEVDATCRGASPLRDERGAVLPGGPLTVRVDDLNALMRLVDEYGSVVIRPPSKGRLMYRLELGR